LPSNSVAERIHINACSEDAVIAARNSKDSQDGFREAIAILEQEFNSIATTLMGTEEFGRTATVVSNLQLRLQKALENHMARQLQRFNLPSRDDITALGERMMNIDDRLVRVEEMLSRMAPKDSKSRAKRPPRTKKPKPVAAKKSS
jgi:hypothetical protein